MRHPILAIFNFTIMDVRQGSMPWSQRWSHAIIKSGPFNFVQHFHWKNLTFFSSKYLATFSIYALFSNKVHWQISQTVVNQCQRNEKRRDEKVCVFQNVFQTILSSKVQIHSNWTLKHHNCCESMSVESVAPKKGCFFCFPKFISIFKCIWCI